MWQRTGALAVHDTTAWALELLAALSGVWPSGITSGEALHALPKLAIGPALCR